MATVFDKKKYFFKGFPKVNYKFGEEVKEVTDFLHRWSFRKSVKSNGVAWSRWILRDQDTVFSVAKTLYGSEYYFWVVMMMNDMIDPFFDYPLDDVNLASFVAAKYGPENVLGVHHYEADEDDNSYSYEPGTIVSYDYINHVPSGTTRNIKTISNYDHEARINEAKRYIKLLKPEFLDQVKREKDAVMKTKARV